MFAMKVAVVDPALVPVGGSLVVVGANPLLLSSSDHDRSVFSIGLDGRRIWKRSDGSVVVAVPVVAGAGVWSVSVVSA